LNANEKKGGAIKYWGAREDRGGKNGIAPRVGSEESGKNEWRQQKEELAEQRSLNVVDRARSAGAIPADGPAEPKGKFRPAQNANYEEKGSRRLEDKTFIKGGGKKWEKNGGGEKDRKKKKKTKGRKSGRKHREKKGEASRWGR